MNENEKPAIGSSEAAVLTVVELIARAAQMSEQHMAYWLDLYYQVRSRHEKIMTPNFDDLLIKVESPDHVTEKLDELEKKIDMLEGDARNLQDVVSGMLTLPDYKNPGRTAWHSIVPPTPPDHYPPAPPRPAGRIEPAPTEKAEEEPTQELRQVTPITADDVEQAEPVSDAVDDAIEKAAASLKKRLTGADQRAIQKKAGCRDGAGYQWREYKRSVLQRLSEARAQGVTSAAIAAASAGKLTENAVMDFLEAAFIPIDDYRELEAALDRLAAGK